MNRLGRWLQHPLTRGLDVDSPATTQLRRRIIAEKPFLRALYQEWYELVAGALPLGDGRVLEIGSGAGFLREQFPEVITSEVFPCEGIDLMLDAHRLPFADGSLRAIIMTDVFHHLADVRRFFLEAARCVRPGGVVTMIEPWVSPWSKLVYTRLHHEPFRVEAGEWAFPSHGPLSGANGALPWIVFARDRTQFEREFADWTIEDIRLLMPFRYLLSGGVSLRSLMPGWSFPVWRAIERRLSPWFPTLAMFAQITLRRSQYPREGAPC